MKTFRRSFFMIVSVLATLGLAGSSSSSHDSGDLDKLEVQIAKSDFIMLEPMELTVSYTFPSGDFTPRISQDLIVEITSQGRTTKFQRLSSAVVSGGIINQPDRSSNNKFQSIKSETIVDRVSEFFPHPGEYLVQFRLNTAESKKFIITIKEPTGLDKAAFDFLIQKHGNSSFEWVWSHENGVAVLEDFVNKYGETIYGDFATRKLADIYLARSRFDRAEPLLEKLAKSERIFIASEARKLLAELRRRQYE